MQETLAAAVMMATGYTGEMPLVGRCAAAARSPSRGRFIAQNRAPGLLRDNYGFMHLKGFDDEAWKAVRREALAPGKRRGTLASSPPTSTRPRSRRQGRTPPTPE